MSQKSDLKPFSFEELFEKLKNVPLKGWPEIKPYQNATFKVRTLSPEEVKETLYTPQPKVYTERLDALSQLNSELQEIGAKDNFWELTEGYDFVCTDETGAKSDWSLIPPVVEILRYPVQVDYAQILKGKMDLLEDAQNLRIEATFPTICDGDHRIYYAVKNNLPITVIEIDNIDPDYPYYALPQKYFKQELATRAYGELPENAKFNKIHILPKEDEKKLYRLFPGGGIHSGSVRPDAKPEEK